MVLDLVGMVLTIVLISLVPIVFFAGLFALIDHLADEEKLEEIRRARNEGRPVDFTGSESDGTDRDAEGSPVTLPSEGSPGESGDHRRHAEREGSETITCKSCGRENAERFDRCWNCQSEL